MKISKIKPILAAAHEADDSVLMEGLHGIGKSEIVKQYCDENGYHYTALFLSHQEVGDLIGIPVTEVINDESVTLWSKPIWLQRMEEAAANGKKCVLLLDELNRAQTDVLNSALQLVLERQIHEHVLPEVNGYRTQIIACTNPDGEDYQVQTLDPALINRFLKIDVEVDEEAWLKWAKENNVNNIVRAFIVDNMTKLHYISEDEIGATPRSWTKLGKFMDLVQQGNLEDEFILDIMRGKIGSALASQFYVFFKNFKDNISIEDIEDMTKKIFMETGDIEKTGEIINEKLDNMESITKLEHVNTLFEKNIDIINDSTTSLEDLVPLFALLYSFEIETLTSFLKDKKANDKVGFYNLMKKDKNKNLAKRIKSKVTK